MKLNETNARYVAKRNSFHGGGVIGFYNSLEEAKQAAIEDHCSDCMCGGNNVFPITEEAWKEINYTDFCGVKIFHDIPLYRDLPSHHE